MNLFKVIVLLLLISALAFPAVPTISGIVLDPTLVTNNTAYLCFDVSTTTAWVSALWGTATGVYSTGRSSPYQVGANRVCIPITGLQGSTTYFALPIAQPDQNDLTDICNASGCGANEVSFTTSADITFPILPFLPTDYPVPNPDTSTGYTTIRLVAGSPECVSATTTGNVTYGPSHWNVNMGDTIQSILNNVGFGARLIHDQATVCHVPGVNVYNSGYWFGYKAVDPNASGINDPAHRWVIIETQQVGAADFPPFGMQTNLTLGAKNAIWQADTQETTLTGLGQVLSVIDDPGSGSTNSPHHLLVRNMTFQVNQTTNTGRWGQISNMGACCGAAAPDYIVFDRIITRGSPLVDTAQGLQMLNTHGAYVNSFMHQLRSLGVSGVSWAQGIFSSPGGVGPYNVSNNGFDCECMSFYQESDTGFTNAANNITLANNRFRMDLSLKDMGYFVRQHVEIKGGHKILIKGNDICCAWVGSNDGPGILLFGISNYVVGSGVSDVMITLNHIHDLPVGLACIGALPGDAGNGPYANATQSVYVTENIFDTLGYANHFGMGGAGGVVSPSIYHRSGCSNFTVIKNTIGTTDAHDTRSPSTQDYNPAIEFIGGSTAYAGKHVFDNNVVFVSYGLSSVNGSRIYLDRPQTDSTYPALPALVPTNSTNTPKQVLDSYAITSTNAGTTPNYSWQRNLHIPFNIETTAGNIWADMNSSQALATATGMPSTGVGNTWATGNTTLLRAAAAGIPSALSGDFRMTPNPLNYGGSIGANIQGVLTAMKIVKEISSRTGPTALQLSYTAPDERGCSVDTSTDGGSTWTRATDTPGSRARVVLVSGLSNSSTVQYRILCYFTQDSSLVFPSEPSNMLTEGTATTTASGTRTISVGLSFPSGAASVKVTMTPLVGSPLTATCNSSPCSVSSVPNGSNLQLIEYYSGSGATGTKLFSGSSWIQ